MLDPEKPVEPDELFDYFIRPEQQPFAYRHMMKIIFLIAAVLALALAAAPAAQAKRAAPTAKRADSEPGEAPASDEDQKVADKLMREAGNWFVMKREDNEEQAVKLLWVNPHTRNMLFVDQHGAKVALMPAGGVARMIREGSVRPMQQEASSFVARSLRRIRRALEDSVNA